MTSIVRPPHLTWHSAQAVAYAQQAAAHTTISPLQHPPPYQHQPAFHAIQPKQLLSTPCSECTQKKQCDGCLTPFARQLDSLHHRVLHPPVIPTRNEADDIVGLTTSRGGSNVGDKQKDKRQHGVAPHGGVQLCQYANSIGIGLPTPLRDGDSFIINTTPTSTTTPSAVDLALTRAFRNERPTVFSRPLAFGKLPSHPSNHSLNHTASSSSLNRAQSSTSHTLAQLRETISDPSDLLRSDQSSHMQRLLVELQKTRDARQHAEREEAAAKVWEKERKNGLQSATVSAQHQPPHGPPLSLATVEPGMFDDDLLAHYDDSIDASNAGAHHFPPFQMTFRPKSAHAHEPVSGSQSTRPAAVSSSTVGDSNPYSSGSAIPSMLEEHRVRYTGRQHEEEMKKARVRQLARARQQHKQQQQRRRSMKNALLSSTTPLPSTHPHSTHHPIRGFVVRLHETQASYATPLVLLASAPKLTVEPSPHVRDEMIPTLSSCFNCDDAERKAEVRETKKMYAPVEVVKVGTGQQNQGTNQTKDEEHKQQLYETLSHMRSALPPSEQDLSPQRLRTLTERTFFHSPDARILQQALTGAKRRPSPLKRDSIAPSDTLLQHPAYEKPHLDDLLGLYSRSATTQHSVLLHTQRQRHWLGAHSHKQRIADGVMGVEKEFDRREAGKVKVTREGVERRRGGMRRGVSPPPLHQQQMNRSHNSQLQTKSNDTTTEMKYSDNNNIDSLDLHTQQMHLESHSHDVDTDQDPELSSLQFQSVAHSTHPSLKNLHLSSHDHNNATSNYNDPDSIDSILTGSSSGFRAPTTAIFRAAAHVDALGRQAGEAPRSVFSAGGSGNNSRPRSSSNRPRSRSRSASPYASASPSPRSHTTIMVDTMRAMLSGARQQTQVMKDGGVSGGGSGSRTPTAKQKIQNANSSDGNQSARSRIGSATTNSSTRNSSGPASPRNATNGESTFVASAGGSGAGNDFTSRTSTRAAALLQPLQEV